MALLFFRSRAASEILMQSETAQRLLDIMEKAPAERGVITPAQIDGALERLLAAVAAEGQPGTAADAAADTAAHPSGDPAAAPAAVGLRQRAFPLIQMLRAARTRQVDVTWGI